MNLEKIYQARVERTKSLIQAEEERLFKYGYNPNTKTYLRKPPLDPDRVTSAPIPEENKRFVVALDYAYYLREIDHTNLLCVKSCLKYLKPSICDCGLNQLPVIDVRRINIKLVMNHCKEKRTLSPKRWKAYRSSLMMFFEAL